MKLFKTSLGFNFYQVFRSQYSVADSDIMQGGFKMAASEVSSRKILGPRPLLMGVSFKIGHCATFALLQNSFFT